MIGMLCERKEAAAGRALTKYDRTYGIHKISQRLFSVLDLQLINIARVFLVACTSTSIMFKFATFSEEYISYYRLGEATIPKFDLTIVHSPEDSTSELTAGMEKLKFEGAESKHQVPPKLVIHQTKQFSLRDWKSAIEIGEYSLAIIEYLQQNGPLLK